MLEAAGITLTAALVAGVAGSGHCFAMCGGLAGALGMRARIAAGGHSATYRNIAAYQLGRIGGYALAGALFGSFGAALQSALDLPRIAVVLRVASGVLLVLVAIRILSGWNALTGLERLGGRVWSKLQPFARHAAGRGELGGNILLGLLWGWMPCGLVYSMLLFAALSGSALIGAALMLAFGLGTLPSMVTSSVLASQLQTALKKRWPRVVSGALLLLFGIWLGVAAITSGQHADHGNGNGNAHHEHSEG